MTRLSIRIDEDIKKKAEIACNKLGITMTDAINMYLVKLGNELRIPFEVSVDPFYSLENRERLVEYIKQIEGDQEKK